MPGRIGILLSGLGFEKGTQVLELPFIYREIERGGGSPVCFVPHETVPIAGRGRVVARRDLFEECAPVVRGELFPVEKADPKKLNALIIPGGRGPITVLSDISDSGSEARVVRSVQDLIIGMNVRKKPIGTLGYGGALAMVALRRSIDEPIITIGEDTALASSLSAFGLAPVNVSQQEVIFDPDNRLFSAAGIAPGSSVVKGSDGVSRLTEAIMEYRERRR